LLALLVVLSTIANAQGQPTSAAPRLVVSIAVDQLRSDYLEAFVPLFGEKGFKRLMSEGAVYTNVAYPFTPVDRASASAALSTGTTPYYNGIVGQRWMNKETLRPMSCTDDDRQKGLYTVSKSSPRLLLTSTIGDELKMATSGKALVYALAPESDAAIFGAGHAADGAFWIDDNSGAWCSSDFYFKQMPSWMVGINGLSAPMVCVASAKWEPTNELVGNFSYFIGGGQQTPFKHTFTGANKYREFKTSGLVNASITDAAMACVNSTGMGNDGVTDLLSVTYFAGNYAHHPIGECQMELQDTYVRLDNELARLIDTLQGQFGADNVLFVLTSTGYTSEEGGDYERYNIPTGTFYMDRSANLLNMYFGAIYGQGRFVEQCFGNQIYLNHKLLEQKRVSIADATGRAQEFLSQLSGVSNVYTSLQLLTTDNRHTDKVRAGFHAERSGDILIEVTPGWQLLNEETQEHLSPRAAYVQFPIIFLGAGIGAQRVTTPVSTERIAPTIARAIRIRAPNGSTAEPLF